MLKGILTKREHQVFERLILNKTTGKAVAFFAFFAYDIGCTKGGDNYVRTEIDFAYAGQL